MTNCWDKLTVVGAVTHTGESFYCWTEDNLTTAHGIRLVKALLEEFGDDLVVFLDRAGYFYNRALWEFVSGEREIETVGASSVSCVRGEDVEVWYFPPKLPELNPVEECWNQLQEWFKYRFVEDVAALKRTLVEGIRALDEPSVWSYLCG